MSNPVIERVYNLGDYKSLHVTITDTEMPHPEIVREGIEKVFDAYEIYFNHQLITHLLNNNDNGVNEAYGSLEKLRSIRDTYFTGEEPKKEMETQNATS